MPILEPLVFTPTTRQCALQFLLYFHALMDPQRETQILLRMGIEY